MFFTLLIVTFMLALLVCVAMVSLFKKPIADIFQRIIKDPISIAWQKYIVFATYVVGISGGVRIYELERYITAHFDKANVLELTAERWVIEIYRTLIETLHSIAWLYLVVFVFALIAYVIVHGFELKNASHKETGTD